MKEDYKSEEKIILIREKLIEYVLKENIEDDILKFHIIIFIQNYETNKNKIKGNIDINNEMKKQINEEEEEEKILKKRRNKIKIF